VSEPLPPDIATDVWPTDFGPTFDKMNYQLGRIADVLEDMARELIDTQDRRSAWEDAEQQALLREAKGE